MATTSVLGKVYETILCSPGMNETVRIDIKLDRKTILLLNSVIERGLSVKESSKDDIIGLVSEECVGELKAFSDECLKKAGLGELSEKIKGLSLA